MMNAMNTVTRCDDFDFEGIEISLRNKTTLDDAITLQEMKQRKIFLNDEIDAGTVENACKAILRYNAEDKGMKPEERKPIYLYLDTYGGGMEAGFRLINTIQMSKTEVRTICCGFCYSMGFLIFIAGHKRYAAEHARFLLHDGSYAVSGSTGKVVDQVKFNERAERRVKDYVCGHTKINPEKYDRNYEKEWYMFADDAKSYGVADYIIGEDCDVDEIV